MLLKNLIWNSEQRRLRMLWRLILQAILLIVLVIPLAGAAGAIGGFVVMAQEGLSPEELSTAFSSQEILSFPAPGALISIAVLVAVVGSIWLAGRFLDRRRFSDFGVHLDRNWWIDLGFGLALGAVLMGLIFLVELAAGWITITGTFQTPSPNLSFGTAILFQLITFICIGIYEEFLSRGYHLKNMSEGLCARPGLGSSGVIIASALLSAALFGLAHAPNPHATVISTFNIFLAGILLALGYILTGELAIPIGIHITWNFFQGNVFGFPVSGTPANSTTLIAIRQGGDALITGGAFGPEAGLIGIGALVLGGLLIVAWVRMRSGKVGLHKKLATPDLRREHFSLRVNQAWDAPEAGCAPDKRG